MDQIPYIGKDAVVTIKCSSGYYNRIIMLITFLLKDLNEEQINQIKSDLGTIDENNIAFHYQTLLVFVSSYLEEAKNQNLVSFLSPEEYVKTIQESSQ